MRTNFSEETVKLLISAKKASICMVMDPVVKAELILLAIIETEHPLWLFIKNKFHLQDTVAKNLITDFLLRNHSDDPENSQNTKEQSDLFDIANKEAQKSNSSFIEPYHLVKAIFLAKDSGVLGVFTQMGVSPAVILEELGKVSYADMISAIEGNSSVEYAPSRQVIQTAEQYCAGFQGSDQLFQFGRNLNALAHEGKLEPVYFRDDEINTTIEILSRKQQNNPLLVGEAGVGKTAIAEGIAQLIVAGKVPTNIKDSQIIELSLTSLVAGTSLRGQFEERIQKVIDECAKNPNIILFIDEIHMIVGSGGEKGLGDAANIFKPALARGNLRCIGATTIKENNQSIEKDKALKRRFEPVFVNEPTAEQTMNILNNCKNRLEDFHGVKINDDSVKAAVEYADRYIKDKSFPGKAIDLLDHACAHEKINPASKKVVTPETIAIIVAKVAQVPITQILGGNTEELNLLEKRIKEKVIGQDSAIQDLVEVIQLTKMGMFIDMQKPEGVLLLVGPAGVGKTEMAKTLATAMLGDDSRLVHFDMNEFKDASSINKLTGAAPGYVGYEQQSRLVTTIRSNPNSIIVMEDIEKAHPDVLALLQEIFERGSLMTQDGETVYFSYATFMLISNLGAEIIDEDATKRLEYAEKCDAVRNILEDEVKKRFLPGFLNAINKVIYFSPLKDEWLKQIAKDKIRLVLVRLEAKGYTVEINGAIEDFLFKNMPSSIRFGARYMNKAIEENILKPLSQYMLNCNKRHFFISIADDKKLEFRCE